MVTKSPAVGPALKTTVYPDNRTTNSSHESTNKPTNEPTGNESIGALIEPTTEPTFEPTVNPTKIVDNTLVPYQVGDHKYSALSHNHGRWLLCDGSAISRTEYPQLFQVYGTKYDSPSATTFNLPDFRGRVPGIISDEYPDATYIGAAITELSIENIPAHYHFISNSGYATGYYSSSHPYLARSETIDGGLLSNENYEYQLRASESLPDYYHSSTVGSGSSFSIIQPTLFGGNIFVFAG